MNDSAPYREELESLSDHRLFAHGACHVFALVLRAQFGYELLEASSAPERHYHIACSPGDGLLLDVYGWFTFHEYQRAEAITNVRFRGIAVEELKRHFTKGPGCGLYAEQAFFDRCEKRAKHYVDTHKQYFDGTLRSPIPNLSRLSPD